MSIEISHIRFICKDHNVYLENSGNGQIFYPTHTIVGAVMGTDDGWDGRQDKDGWLTLDTSELFCSECIDDFDQGLEPDQNWAIEAR